MMTTKDPKMRCIAGKLFASQFIEREFNYTFNIVYRKSLAERTSCQ